MPQLHSFLEQLLRYFEQLWALPCPVHLDPDFQSFLIFLPFKWPFFSYPNYLINNTNQSSIALTDPVLKNTTVKISPSSVPPIHPYIINIPINRPVTLNKVQLTSVLFDIMSFVIFHSVPRQLNFLIKYEIWVSYWIRNWIRISWQ